MLLVKKHRRRWGPFFLSPLFICVVTRTCAGELHRVATVCGDSVVTRSSRIALARRNPCHHDRRRNEHYFFSGSG